jgi:C_GCAxxG_C_C family probable redox protein
MNKAASAVNTFKQGFNCAQAVLSVFSDELGLDPRTAMHIASGFGGGMGRCAETCGAVTGAVMALSLRGSLADQENLKPSDKTYALVQRFILSFKEIHGSVACRDLLGCDISKDDMLRKARKEGLFQSLCPKFVEDAVNIAAGLF